MYGLKKIIMKGNTFEVKQELLKKINGLLLEREIKLIGIEKDVVESRARRIDAGPKPEETDNFGHDRYCWAVRKRRRVKSEIRYLKLMKNAAQAFDLEAVLNLEKKLEKIMDNLKRDDNNMN